LGPTVQSNRAIAGWELSTIVQLQSGNPFTIFANNPTGVTLSTFNGQAAHSPRCWCGARDQPVGNQWFTGSTCDPRGTTPAAIAICGSNPNFILPVNAQCHSLRKLQRNAFVGPGFQNIDFSILKNTKLTERFNTQFRSKL